MPADLVEEQLEGVGRRDGEIAVHVRRVLGVVAGAVVGQVDLAPVELVVERLEFVVVDLRRLHELVELGQVDAPLLLSALEQGLNLRGYVALRHRSWSSRSIFS